MCSLILGMQNSTNETRIPNKSTFMVWDADCLTAVEKGPETRLEAPLKDDGTADMSHAKALFVRITLKSNCAHIEVRKEQQ